jgi:hypothetical protein
VAVAKGSKTPEQPTGNGLKRLEDRLSRARVGAGFPAYVRANFDRLSRIIEASPRGVAKWAELAKLAGENGLQPNTAKRAYEREKKRREKLVAAGPKREQPARTAPPVMILSEVAEKPDPPMRPERVNDPIEALKREMNQRSGRKG